MLAAMLQILLVWWQIPQGHYVFHYSVCVVVVVVLCGDGGFWLRWWWGF